MMAYYSCFKRWGAICLLLIALSACRTAPARSVQTPPIPLRQLTLTPADFGPSWTYVISYKDDTELGGSGEGIFAQFRPAGPQRILVTHDVAFDPASDTIPTRLATSVADQHTYPAQHAQHTSLTCFTIPASTPSARPVQFCEASARYGSYVMTFSSHIDDTAMTYAHFQQMLQLIDQKMARVVQP